MINFAQARNDMVQKQLVARGIRDPKVLSALGEVPRHLFVDESLRDEAYDDNPLPIGEGQTISQPYMVAIMTELLGLRDSDRVLEIGTGSGYQAAVLSCICQWVYTIERFPFLSERARRITSVCNYRNISFRVADGTQGWPEEAPFDGIIVTAGAPRIPKTLVAQLAPGGRLIIPVGNRFSQTLKRFTRRDDGDTIESFTGCRFVDLVGEHGWSPSFFSEWQH
ncbi:protein-L-isoaspartate and D-aspartate O-methyltransferase [Desulfomonile tiedjei DSM 6799]|uniref:Protein-L-isoaspartate O-methyltransferase n=1 Tax=Desulfomonile tiedjei (strain ATCC 49306 / DSM 6799 / DCB-1) TaxID=706587 RepID=I4C4G6_DESTA|nr:protein-L-isoaspartate(D-aspartate) O-methyltransferase [Desulfomonile tiedjei]AFM24457.1 protein-L-isoaspartate and D-aspartate O-methyltransferase [Desulfomonile tiedjei DSM 6799]